MTRRIQTILTSLVYFSSSSLFCQSIANYITNGSFEERINCSGVKIYQAIGWSSIDSVSFGGGYMNVCLGNIPKNANTYQFPRTGDAYILNTWYNEYTPFSGIGYMKNRLKTQLKPGTTYCAKFYVNIANTSPRGIDSFGAYFGDQSIDTITKCNQPLIYLTPQVSNPSGNIISDTLNWVPITWTFVATGNEKYLILGNFKSNTSIQTTSINTPFYPQKWTDVCVDDVSCIEVNINAYAGKDTAIVPGDSAFIGRQPDFAIDPFCTWYQWPNMSTPIEVTSGMWVKPVITTTYIVKQNLECGNEKWDTVVVYMNLVGLSQKFSEENFEFYPQPAQNELTIKIKNEVLINKLRSIAVFNQLGQLIREKELVFENQTFLLLTGDLPAGVYNLQVTTQSSEKIRKKFVVAR